MISVSNRSYKVNENIQDVHPLEACTLLDLYNSLPLVIENMTQQIRRVLNFLLYLSNKFPDVYPKQDTIALWLGISRRYCNEVLGMLQEKGLITSNYRHMKSCQYKVAPIFFDVAMRERLVGLLPALKWLPSILLTMCQQNFLHQKNSFKDEQFSQLEYRRLRLNNNLILFPSKKRTRKTCRDFACQQILNFYYWQKNIIESIKQKIPSMTVKGIARLYAFSVTVLEFANDQLTTRKLRKLAKPYEWLFKTLLDRSARESLPPNWRWVAQLERFRGIPAKQPLYIENRTYKQEKNEFIKGEMCMQPQVRPDAYLPFKGFPERPKETVQDVVKSFNDPRLDDPKVKAFTNLLGSSWEAMKLKLIMKAL